MKQNQQMRLPYIDNLRAIIIIVVVMVHTAFTYTGLGLWHLCRKQVSGYRITDILGSFISLAQSFDISFLFMLAGYFIPLSFDVKGPARFIKDRLYRLGLPLLIYITIIDPLPLN